MKNKKIDNKHRLLLLSLIGLFLCALIIPIVMMSSGKSLVRFFGTIAGDFIIILILLGLGVAQFIPRVFKGRKTWKLVLMWVLGFLWISFSVILINIFSNYIYDVHYAIHNNYSTYDGELTTFHISHGRSTRTYFTINNRKYNVSGEYESGFLIKGRKYRVEYLPNSKFIMNLYRYGE